MYKCIYNSAILKRKKKKGVVCFSREIYKVFFL